MTSIRTLTLALASLMAVSPAAFAQDASTDTASSAAGKRFAVVGGAAILHPDSDPLPGSRIDIDGDIAPTISASWYATDNIAVELWGAADKFNHRVRGDAGKIGTVEQQPMALSGQYHFGTPDQVMRPFVGLGYYESNFSNEDIAGGGDHVGLETAKGAIATAGVDFNINERWFARADARYLHETNDPQVQVNGQDVADAKFSPVTVGVGVGVKF